MKTIMKEGKYMAKAMGMRVTQDINMEGRVQIDMMIHMMKEKKLSSYTLNAVSYTFLGQQKEDVQYSIIKSLQFGDSHSRKRIATYCLKDAYLPLRLFEKFKCMFNYVEMARVTGVSINFLLKRGQQIKVLSQLYRKAKVYNMVVPVNKSFKKKGDEIGYQGAYVLDPKCGFYTNPIATLDFASLYPSIMIAHNLCYSTMIDKKGIQSLGLKEGEDYFKTPTDEPYYFIKQHRRKGLLPIILEDILTARRKAKRDLADAEDKKSKATTEQERQDWDSLVGVYDGRQLALKVSANSVYGFTGAQVGALPCLQIAGTVTAVGRRMIDATRNWVIEYFNKKNGFEADADVIYGDTDSVMINFGVES
jgi:DNA polymerase delta subunit 1